MSTVKVTCTLTRRYGSYDASFGLESTIEPQSRNDIIREQERLQGHIMACILDFEANTLRQLPGNQRKAQPITEDVKGEDGKKREWVKALGIVKEDKKGKTYYYAKTAPGTKWAKFGVSLYWDNFQGMSELEYQKRMDKAGELVLPEDFYVLVVSQTGKPDRAIALSHKDNIGE